MYQVLLLEDNESFGYILSEYLSMKDFQVNWAKTGKEAIRLIDNKAFDIAILDIMLPDVDGYEVAKVIKHKNPSLPFIFLSAKSLKIDKLKGFKVGAFDYITKPIEEEILVAKIHALLNQMKVAIPKSHERVIGQYLFKPGISKLYFLEEEIKLTVRESELLKMLCDHENQLMPRKLALQQIWGSTDEFSRKSMDVFISHLRKYLAQDSSISIENLHGKGFILRC